MTWTVYRAIRTAGGSKFHLCNADGFILCNFDKKGVEETMVRSISVHHEHRCKARGCKGRWPAFDAQHHLYR